MNNGPELLNRRAFSLRAATNLLVGSGLAINGATGCKDKSATRLPSFDALLARLDSESTLESFSAALALEQNRRLKAKENGFTEPQLTEIRSIFYKKACADITARGIKITPEEIKNDRRLANDKLNPYGIIVLEASWPLQDGTFQFDGSIARFKHSLPFKFPALRIGEQVVTEGGQLAVIEITEQLSKPYAEGISIEGRLLGPMIVKSPMILFSESATREGAIKDRIPYEEERAFVLNNELGHFIFESLIPLQKLPSGIFFRMRTKSGIQITTSIDKASELCSDYFSLTQVPQFRFERYLEELWHGNFENYRTCIDLSYACCLKHVENRSGLEGVYSIDKAKKLFMALIRDPKALAEAKNDYLKESAEVISSVITITRGKYGAP